MRVGGGYMTGASIGLRFKADWEIWSSKVPRVALQAFEADVCETVVSPELLSIYN